MSRRIVPNSVDADNARTAVKQKRQTISTPTVTAIKDPQGRVRVRIGAIAGRYGVRVYNSDGSVAYDFTVT